MADRALDAEVDYGSLSRRLVEVVVAALGQGEDVSLERLAQAHERAHEELVRGVGPQIQTLEAYNHELQVMEEELRVQQDELAAQNRDLHEAQRAIEAEQRRYQELFDFAPDAYLVTAPNGCIMEANRLASTYLGVAREFLVGKPLVLFVEEGDHGAFMEQLHRLETGQETVVRWWQVRLRPRGGRPFQAEVTVMRTHDPRREEAQLRWLVRDVSERVRMEERLAFQAQMLDQVGDAVIAIDPQQRVTYANRRAIEQYGLEGQEFEGRELSELYDYRFLSLEEEKAANAALAAEGKWRGRNIHVLPDGGERVVASTVIALDDGAPGPGLLAAIRDISEQVEVERERDVLFAQSLRDRDALAEITRDLERERDLLETIMDSTHAKIAYLDPAFNFVRVNAAYCEEAGYEQEELVGRNHFEVFPHAENRAIFERVRDTGEGVAFEAKPFAAPGQNEVSYWDWTLSPLPDAAGGTRGFVLSLHDVTVRERLLKENRERRALLQAIIDHAPLGIVVTDEKGRIVLTNPMAKALYGRAVPLGEGYESHGKLMLVHPDDAPYDPRDLPLTRSALDGETHRNLEMAVAWPGGERRELLVSTAPIRDDDGQISGAVGILQDITERVQREQQIGQLRRQNELILDSAGDGIVGIDGGGRVDFANPAAAEMVGWRPEEMVGQPIHELVHHTKVDGASYPETACMVQATLADGAKYEVSDEVFWRQDGTFFPVEYTSSPIIESNHVSGAVLVFRDISERKQAEQTLARYAGRLRILHETDQAILAARTPLEIADTTLKHLQRLIPYLRASVILFDVEQGEMSLLAVHPGGGTPFDHAWRHPLGEDGFFGELEAGRVQVVEDLDELFYPSTLIRVLRAEGVRAYVNVPLIAQGTLIGSLNVGMPTPGAVQEEQIEIAREVADGLAIGIRQAHLAAQVEQHAERLEGQVRRRTAALRVSQARFRAVFEEAAIGIALLGRRGDILVSNPALQRILGYSADELQGMRFSRLAHPANGTDDAVLYQELMEGERDYYAIEGRYVHKDGQPIDVNVTMSLVRSTKGQSRLAIVLFEDVTERKAAQAALVQSEKMAITGRMAASLAHEINNPLQSVIGCLSLAEEDLGEGKSALRYVEIALEELERAAGLVARMRDLNRTSAEPEREPTDVNTLLERVLMLTRKRCEEQRVRVVWEPGAKLPRLSLLSDRIQQVFLNLMLNAVDAMPEGGRLEIGTRRTEEPEGVEVRFSDSGLGIPAENLGQMFEPFYTTKDEGLGLGLYVSQGIVQEHGGQIEVESVAGDGATFKVWLPV